MPDIREDDRVVVARSNFNVANVISAIALLILVLGVLKYFHAMPF
jgi:hypothetical protein